VCNVGTRATFADARRHPLLVPEPPTADSLVVRAQRGDIDAFAALYDRHAPGVYADLLARVNDPDAAEALLGQVFAQVIRDLPLHPATTLPFEAWVLAIADNICRPFGDSAA